MKITAITKFKNGELFEALKKAGWTQSDLARHSKINQCRIGGYCNLQRVPTEAAVNAIQRAFAEVGIYFDPLAAWPKGFLGIKERKLRVEHTADISLETMIGAEKIQFLEGGLDSIDVKLGVESALETLPPRYRRVIEARFFENRSSREIGEKEGVSGSAINQIEHKALRMMRHPARTKLMLGDQVDGSVGIAVCAPSNKHTNRWNQ